MSFILIASTPSTLPFAVNIDGENADACIPAITAIEEEKGFMTGLFLIDTESRSVQRLLRNEDGWFLSDSAYNDSIGVMTTSDFFMEAAE